METKVSTYKDLIVWQKAIQLVTNVYILTNNFPPNEKYGLVSQLNRAVISIPTNIAEGWGRELPKNYLQFLRIARGSLMETETILLICKNLNFIDEKEFLSLSIKVDEVGRILQGLINGVKRKTLLKETE